MMATRAIPHDPPAPARYRPFTRGSGSTRTTTAAVRASRLPRPPAFVCPRSADLAGRAVALSADIPVHFDDPLAPHHKLIGRWVAAREATPKTFTRVRARRHIERVFETAVLDTLGGLDMVDFRTVVLRGPEGEPAAIALVCESIGQIDLGWIESSDAPTAWRASAYQALERTLGIALPIFGYADLFEEISHYYWDGETDDDAARQALIDYHGADPEEVNELTLPSEMEARRPDWMLAANAGSPKRLPTGLRQGLCELMRAYRELRRIPPDRNAWFFDTGTLYDYLPGIEECSSLPPLTLVPVEQFACEVDDVARHGMEYGFMDVSGLCPITEARHIDSWFASLRVGAQFLAAAQALIRLDPTSL